MLETARHTDSSPSRLEALTAAAVAAGRAASESGYLQEAVEQLSRLTGAERCSLHVLRDGRLYGGGSVGLPDRYLEALEGLPAGPEVGTCGRAAATGAPVVTHDIAEDPRWDAYRGLAESCGLRACWSVPLVLPDGRLLGTFASYADRPRSPSAEELELAHAHASLVALGLDRIQHEERLTESYEAVVVALSSALDVRDEQRGGHASETARLAAMVGRALGLPADELRTLDQVAMLHDIGKLGIPAEVLKSTEALSAEQRELIREHPLIGEQILGAIPFLEHVARAVRHEHERWDGGGYPDGVAGDAIPLASRIVFACDAWHAMTSDRPYRAALETGAALAELRAGAGTQFDPRVVEVLLEVLGEEAATPAGGAGSDDAEEARLSTLGAVAAALGAEDLFVFRKVAPEQFCHFGGVGRGEGWAGNVQLDSREDEHFLAALERRGPLCLSFPERGRVVGPYYARTAVLVPRRDELVVVFGSSTDSLAGACREDAVELAERAAAAVEDVSPAKRLADELEVLEAVRSVSTVTGDDLEHTLAGIADAAAAALSCEFGAVVAYGDGGSPRLGWAARGWTPADPEELDQLLVPFLGDHSELPLLVQDVAACGTVPPALGEAGAASIHALPIGRGPLGVMVMIHANPAPRGFTMLCQRVARAVAEAAEVVIRRALLQEELAEENARLSRRVATDALTGVASRAAWDEALEREELHRRRSGAPTSVAVFDLDSLKAVNDGRGHTTGDELLKECAALLAGESRATDFVARIGGDEFAVLLRYTDEDDAAVWAERFQGAVSSRNARRPELVLSVAAGFACAPPSSSLAEAFDAADRRMYEAKQARVAR